MQKTEEKGAMGKKIKMQEDETRLKEEKDKKPKCEDAKQDVTNAKEKVEEVSFSEQPKKSFFGRKQKFKQLTMFEKNDYITKSAIKTRVLIPRVKYKGPLSYRGIRLIAFLFLFLGIFAGFLPLFVELKGGDVDVANKIAAVFEWTEQIALPLFLVSAFSMILARKKETIQTMIRFFVLALFIYIATIFVFEHYVINFFAIAHPEMTPAELRAFANAKTIAEFGEIIHYNIFLDMLLCCSFYFFLMWTPKKIKKNHLGLFRACSSVPILYVVTSMVLFALNNNQIINLPVACYALLVCRSPAVYLVFFFLVLFMKTREKIFARMGGNAFQYQAYLQSNANTFHFSLFYSVNLAIVSLFDFVLSFIPGAQSLGFGTSFMMFLAIPFVMLLRYTKDYKNKSIDIILPVVFMGLVLFVVVELLFQFLIS